MTAMETRMEIRFEGLENRLESVENEQTKMSEKVDRIDSAFDQTNFDTLALNKRVFRMEAEMERLTQQ